jgi:hypothetical protein
MALSWVNAVVAPYASKPNYPGGALGLILGVRKTD